MKTITSGHYYRCPQGHLFVIGECGMAMQQSNCPECGQSVGGSSHTLLSTNTHASDFELRMQQTRQEQARQPQQ